MNDIETFKFLVKLYAQLYTSVELMDTSIHVLKSKTKWEMRKALDTLEKDIRKAVLKLYENEEEMIFQNLQEAISEHLNFILNNKIEDIVNGYNSNKEKA